MPEENKRIIEINGIKLEVDLTTCRRIDEFRVGDNVKILIKKSEYQQEKLLNGVIVEFLNFKDAPIIQLAVFEQSYSGSSINFINYSANTANMEIMACGKHELVLEKSKTVDQMQNEIDRKQHEVDDLRNKLNWFLKFYGKHFADAEKDETGDAR